MSGETYCQGGRKVTPILILYEQPPVSYDSPCEKANCFSGWMNRSNNDIIVEYFNNVEICGFGCENGNPFNSNRVKSLELNSLFSFE